MIYIEIATRVYKLRLMSFPEIIADSNLWWKGIAVNAILAALLTLRLASAAQSLTFLNYALGVGLYSFFAANFNTKENSYDRAYDCFALADRVADLIDWPECQEILSPLYLYSLSALCVAVFLLELLLLGMGHLLTALGQYCCRRERKQDMQALRLNARRKLEYELV